MFEHSKLKLRPAELSELTLIKVKSEVLMPNILMLTPLEENIWSRENIASGREWALKQGGDSSCRDCRPDPDRHQLYGIPSRFSMERDIDPIRRVAQINT